ncbi:MAG: VanZ family protein [Planctomycetota bacterium]|nr:VanZ family protein [Planctomycetota bacterium]
MSSGSQRFLSVVRRASAHRLARGGARVAFVAFAALLFVATHWPALQVPGAEVRSDLVIHLVVFAAWTILLARTGYLPSARSGRGVGILWLVAAAYACIDEGSQAIPALRRVAAWDDLTANLLGVTLGAFVAFGLARLLDQHPGVSSNRDGGQLGRAKEG